MVGRKNKKPFVAPAGWQKRRKVENPPRYHSSLFPVLETHSTGYHHIPATVTGAPVCIYSISTQPLYSQFGSLIALCLAPTGTSLRGSPCLLLCVIAFCWLHHSKVKTKCQQLFCQQFIFCKSCSRKKSGRFFNFVQKLIRGKCAVLPQSDRAFGYAKKSRSRTAGSALFLRRCDIGRLSIKW